MIKQLYVYDVENVLDLSMAWRSSKPMAKMSSHESVSPKASWNRNILGMCCRASGHVLWIEQFCERGELHGGHSHDAGFRRQNVCHSRLRQRRTAHNEVPPPCRSSVHRSCRNQRFHLQPIRNRPQGTGKLCQSMSATPRLISFLDVFTSEWRWNSIFCVGVLFRKYSVLISLLMALSALLTYASRKTYVVLVVLGLDGHCCKPQPSVIIIIIK